MAIMLKSRQEIAHLREAGRIVAETYEVLRPYIVPGMNTAELDRIAEEFEGSNTCLQRLRSAATKKWLSRGSAIPRHHLYRH